MLYKNDEVVNLKKDKAFNTFREDMKEKYTFPIKFKCKASYLSESEDVDGNIHVSMAPYYVSYVSTEYTELGSETWRYSPAPSIKKSNGVIQYPKKGDWFKKKSFTFQSSQMDLLYFLVEKSKQFNTVYQIDDRNEARQNFIKERQDELKINKIFYDPDSILIKDEAKLRKVAKACNVPNVDRSKRDEILINLERTVREQDKKNVRPIKEFLEMVNVDFHAEVSANIQKAVEKNIIFADEKGSAWFFMNDDSTIGNKIMVVDKEDWGRRYSMLKDHLLEHRDLLDLLTKRVTGDAVPDEMKLNFNNLYEEDYDKVLAFCSYHGIPSTGRGRKKVDVFNDICNKVGIDRKY